MSRPPLSILLAFTLSGAAALGYQILWTRLLGLALGHEMLAVMGVVSGYFAGMALGAAVLDGRIRRSRSPVKWFAALEGIAAAFALGSPFLLTKLVAGLPLMLGGTQSVGFLALTIIVATVALLPGTFCIGATFAALLEAWRRANAEEPAHRATGFLYAANTLGAALGVLVTVHVLLPAWGMVMGGAILASVGFAAAFIALRWGGGARGVSETVASQGAEKGEKTHARFGVLQIMLVVSGGAGIGFEIIGVRVLSQILKGTVFTFAHILTVYLLGTFVGAGLYAWAARRFGGTASQPVLAGLLLGLTLSLFVAGGCLAGSAGMVEAVVGDRSGSAIHFWSESLAAAAVFLLPTVLMGGLFCHLIGSLADWGVGKAYALNTLGSTAGPLVFGLLGLSILDYSSALYTVSYAYFALFLLALLALSPRRRLQWLIGGVTVTICGQLLAPASLRLIDPPDGWHFEEVREGVFGITAVTEEDSPSAPQQPPWRRLQIDQDFFMGGNMAFGERRMGHLSLLFKPEAEDVLFLGVGTGATLGTVKYHPVKHVDAVELVPDVIEFLPRFDAINDAIDEDERVHIHAVDARRFIASTDRTYDLVVADFFHPTRDGAAFLFTAEHFRGIRRRLKESGVFVQWLPLHQLEARSLKTIVRTFLHLYPDSCAFLGIFNAEVPGLALAGWKSPPAKPVPLFQVDAIQRRLSERGEIRAFVSSSVDLLGSCLMDAGALERFAGSGKLNTDLNPAVLFDAPLAAYNQQLSFGADNMHSLLAHDWDLPVRFVGEARAQEILPPVHRYANAAREFLRGEVIRARSSESGELGPITRESVAAYIQAYLADPGFAPARGVLAAVLPNEDLVSSEDLVRILERRHDNRLSRLARQIYQNRQTH